MRDNLLGLRIIWVELSNEDEAYVVFETLNSRGKDLEVADLLKNLLLNKLRGSGNTAADGPRESWMRMRLQFEESEVNIDVNRFILHWWLSNRAYVAQKKLFRAIKAKSEQETKLKTPWRSSRQMRLFIVRCMSRKAVFGEPRSLRYPGL